MYYSTARAYVFILGQELDLGLLFSPNLSIKTRDPSHLAVDIPGFE